MRDDLDTQTADLLPRKRGRPCQDFQRGPRTPAERAYIYRLRRKVRATVASCAAAEHALIGDTQLDVPLVSILDALRSAIDAGSLTRAQAAMHLLNARLVVELG
jgi:hypothetical protein